ncbi:hypothetical protein [Streptodolium elevatio]
MEPREPEPRGPEPREPEPREAALGEPSTGATPEDTHEGTGADTSEGTYASADDSTHETAYESTPENADGDPPVDSPDDTPERDSEETKVLGIEQSAATEPPATSHVPVEDPDWRPGLLPRDPGVSGTRGTSGVSGSTAPFFAASESAPKSFGSSARSPRGDIARRHGFDPMAMVAGAIFMAIAVMYMLDAGDAVDARPGLMLALAVIAVGASGFVGAVWAMLTGRRRRRAVTADAEASAVDLTKAG